VEYKMKNKNKINKGICIATPFYSEDVKVQYMESMLKTHLEFQKSGIPIINIFLYNTSLITKARNELISKFMNNTDLDYFIFIDSDMSFKPKDIIKLMNYEKEIIGATYPKKVLNWMELQKGIINNVAENSIELIQKTSKYTIYDKKKNKLSNGLMEIERLGTGFMMIKRSLIEKMEKKYPNLMYKMEKQINEKEKDRKKGYGFFDSRLINKEHISEDYSFCEYVKGAGEKIYIDPKIELGHHGGNLSFFGNYEKHIDYGNRK